VSLYSSDQLEVFAGDVVYASDFNAVAARLPRTYVKETGTSRNTTTTLADDPDLSGIALEVGRYQIDLYLFYTQTTTNTQDIKTRWAFTGTWTGTTSVRNVIGIANDSTAAANVSTGVNMAGSQLSGQDSLYGGPAAAAYNSARETAINVEVTVAGTLSLQWAQNASSANNITVQAGSAFVIHRIE
jgi:hypothetical protein